MELKNLRNIGISAHIDSGKTTLSERILFYTGKSHRMGEVHDGGATMDHMELEQERGITITSAATSVAWGEHTVTLIDTPGHVDFTVEVERALRVLDGAVLVLCAVGGVQAQSITIDRQMKRYDVPRLALVNKMDRVGANPERVVAQLKEKLDCDAVLMQLPIGRESSFEGVVDLVAEQALYFDGPQGETIRVEPIPESMRAEVTTARRFLLESLSMYSDALMELLLTEQEVPLELVHHVVKSATTARQLTPVFLASAYKNKGVQPLLDAVVRYLPSPMERDIKGMMTTPSGEVKNVRLHCDPASPAVAMAFKIVEDPYGTLTFLRIYQGRIEKGQSYYNARTKTKERISRIFRMHAADRAEVNEAGAGEIVAVLGLDTASGDTYTAEPDFCTLESIFIPEPVIQVAIRAKQTKDADRLAKALYRFRREDPTLTVVSDPESGQTLLAGMGELHLDVYIERIRREYKLDVETGVPNVNYREAPTQGVPFDVKHRKQSGGSGQYAHICGIMSPIPEDDTSGETFIFEEKITGGVIPIQYIPAIEKGYRAGIAQGPLARYPIVGLKILVNDGSYHDVDSSDLAFRICAQTSLRETFPRLAPVILEPVMKLEIESPSNFQGNVVGDLTSRRGIIHITETIGNSCRVEGEIPLAETFGYMTTLRSLTQGQGTFSMEFLKYKKVPAAIQEAILKERKRG